jgi:MYXO-CTERM domain-containing protein
MRASPVKRANPKDAPTDPPTDAPTDAPTGAEMVRLARGIVGLVAFGAISLAAPRAAHANNGIPGSLGILLPLDKPLEIGLATTFGLILSDDGGTSWVWTCEQLSTTSMADVYTVGAPPTAVGGIGDRLYARSLVTGLAFSDDDSCGWHSAGGALAGQKISDFFSDPNDPLRVLAAASPSTDGGTATAASVYASTDGGATFAATPIYSAPAGAAIVGIEIARSDAQVIYLTTYTVTSTGYDPVLVRSANGGQSWTPTDLLATPLGSGIVRILAVDPSDANLVYLRVTGATSEILAVTRDGGTTFATPLTVANGAVSAFARLASGTVLVGTLVNLGGGGGGTMGVGYRSVDKATTFSPWTLNPQPHLVGLGERVTGGQSTLYLSGKNYSDGWALAISTDEGLTVTPVMSYDQVSGIKPCVRQLCLDTCNYEEMQAIWDPSVCTGGADGGASDAGTKVPAGSSGCHCAAAGGEQSSGRGFASLFVAGAAIFRQRRRRLGTRQVP